MKVVRLTENEFNYLISVPFLTSEWQVLFSSASKKNNSEYFLTIIEEKADELRDLCEDHLEVVGFDETYQLTKEGKILESLIDKLFIG